MPIPKFHQPSTQVVSDRLWKLVADYQCSWIDSNDQINRITVPKGFVFNGASVPQVFWSLGVQPHGLIVGPATIHDFIYRFSGLIPRGNFHTQTGGLWVEREKKMVRGEADILFRNIMELAGIAWWRRWSAYYAVKFFGGKFWGR